MTIRIPVLLGASLLLFWMSASAQDFLKGHIIHNIPREAMADRYLESRKQLDDTYQELFRQLDQIGRQKLDMAQTAWRRYSVAECDFKIHHSAVEPLHPMTYNECLIGMNVERTADLSNELQWHQLLSPGT